MERHPISILISAYNEKPVDDAIETCLNQDIKTTGHSLRILKQFSTNDSRIMLFHFLNIGLAKSLNHLWLCQPEFIAWMDAENICLADKLKKQSIFLQKLYNQT